jgi:hypothetical protein
MEIEFYRHTLEKILIYQISGKSFQWEPRCSMWANGQTEMKIMHPKTKQIFKISFMRNRLEKDAQHDGTLDVQNSKCV